MKGLTIDPPCKYGSARFKTVNPWNLYLINIVENIVVFLSLKVFNSENSCMFPFMEMHLGKSQFKIFHFYNYKSGYLIHSWPDKVLRVPLWIGRCLLCMEGYLKLRLQSLLYYCWVPLTIYKMFSMEIYYGRDGGIWLSAYCRCLSVNSSHLL